MTVKKSSPSFGSQSHVIFHEGSRVEEVKMQLQPRYFYICVLIISAFVSSQAVRYRCHFIDSRCHWVIDTSATSSVNSATAVMNEAPTTTVYPENFTYTYTNWLTSRNKIPNMNSSRPPMNLTERLNVSNADEAFNAGLSKNDSVQLVSNAIETLASNLNQAQLSNYSTEDLIKISDEALKYVNFSDINETKDFLDVSSRVLVGSLSGSDSAIQQKDVLVKIEEYAVAAANGTLASSAENVVNMDLRTIRVTFCRSETAECSFESNDAKFESVGRSDLLVTFIEHKPLENDLFLVDSVITSASARDLSGNRVSIPVTFTLKHNEVIGSESSSCVFLNTTTAQWSTDGCGVIEGNSTHIKCACDHTTNFAILFLHSSVGLNKEDEFWFNLMTYIGCGVSITSLIATMAIFVVLRLHHAERVIILWNLCFCLCSAQLILVAGTTAQIGTVGCQVIAILLHFFFTASFSWMLMEGIHLYMKASNARGGKYKFKMILVSGWALPICIISISMGIGLDQYGSGNACWLSISNGFIWAFIGPAMGIIAVNSIVLIFVIKVFLGLKSISKTSEREKIKKATKAVLFLMPLLGITWIFGLLAFDESTKWFLYLFCICNSLQGLAIFILQCAKNDDVRKAFFKKYRRTFVSIGSYSSGASGSSNKTNDSYMSTDHPVKGLPTIAKW